MENTTAQLTSLLLAWRNGDRNAGDRLVATAYRELRRLAAAYLRHERAGHTLEATALVHELYLKLFGSEPIAWQNRAHFFAIAAQQMRRLLIDHARARRSRKRGGLKVSLSAAGFESVQRDEGLIALDEALQRLEALDARASRVVELRFFAGLQEDEAAEVLGISPATLRRDWKFARSWLMSQFRGNDANTDR